MFDISREVFDILKERFAGKGKIVIHHCGACRYPCGFLWTSGGQLLYDSGCHCSRRNVTGKRDDSDFIRALETNRHTDMADRLLAQPAPLDRSEAKP